MNLHNRLLISLDTCGASSVLDAAFGSLCHGLHMLTVSSAAGISRKSEANLTDIEKLAFYDEERCALFSIRHADPAFLHGHTSQLGTSNSSMKHKETSRHSVRG